MKLEGDDAEYFLLKQDAYYMHEGVRYRFKATVEPAFIGKVAVALFTNTETGEVYKLTGIPFSTKFKVVSAPPFPVTLLTGNWYAAELRITV